MAEGNINNDGEYDDRSIFEIRGPRYSEKRFVLTETRLRLRGGRGNTADASQSHRMWGQYMKKVRIVFFAALGLLLATAAQARSHHANSGVVHFVGQIVEEGCGTEVQRERVQISCYRNGVNHIQQVALKANGNTYAMKKLGTIAQRVIPGHPELQEMTITYF